MWGRRGGRFRLTCDSPSWADTPGNSFVQEYLPQQLCPIRVCPPRTTLSFRFKTTRPLSVLISEDFDGYSVRDLGHLPLKIPFSRDVNNSYNSTSLRGPNTPTGSYLRVHTNVLSLSPSGLVSLPLLHYCLHPPTHHSPSPTSLPTSSEIFHLFVVSTRDSGGPVMSGRSWKSTVKTEVSVFL